MAMFVWKPARRPFRTRKPRVKSIRFGDGYEQRFPDGLNTMLASWELAFRCRSRSVADAIDDFLYAQAGADAFDWTDPLGNAGKYICREWRRDEIGRGLAVITATFEQVPA